MKIKLPQKDLSLFAKRISPIIEHFGSSIYSDSGQFSIQAYKNNRIVLYSENDAISIEYDIEAQVISPGYRRISSKSFTSFIKEMSSDEMTITSVNPQVAEIKQNYISCSISCSDVEEKRAENIIEEPIISINVPVEDMRNILHYTSYIVARDDMFKTLQGIQFLINTDNELVSTCSDGRRLAIYKYKLNDVINIKDSIACIVPLKCIEEIEKHIITLNTKHTINMTISMNRIVFVMDDLENKRKLTISSKLIVGDFPNASSVIPNSYKIYVKDINKNNLINAVKLSSAFATNKYPSIKLSIQKDKIITCGSSPMGQGIAEVSCDCSVQEKMTIAFNPAMMLSILRKYEGYAVNIRIQSPFTPVLVEEVSFGNATLKGSTFIMPMRVLADSD
ncbi:MAG: hypothetical protein KAH32_00745 [Chlamydiia bacterium]|nr:hypothetical protein [Chlamydiia bacterium]